MMQPRRKPNSNKWRWRTTWQGQSLLPTPKAKHTAWNAMKKFHKGAATR
ncbi:hypothetical protein [Vibrio fluvialis]|nr:hypothetical protein [Vibrio fluvialis]